MSLLLVVALAATTTSAVADNDAPLFRIQNAWQRDADGPRPDAYLNIETGRLRASPIKPTWHSAIWALERVDKSGEYRIRSYWKADQYIHMERGRLEVGPIEEGWLSALWKLERIGESKQYRLRSVWKPTYYIHVESGQLQVGPIEESWHSARWLVTSTETVSAAAPPTGLDREKCIEWAYASCAPSLTTATARDKAREACKVIEDLEVAKLLFAWNFKSLAAPTALERAAKEATADLADKRALLVFVIEGYYKSLSAATAVERAVPQVRKLDAAKLDCLRREFEVYYQSLSAPTAMDKAFAACQ